jgi:hypothetical protein
MAPLMADATPSIVSMPYHYTDCPAVTTTIT